VTKGRVLLVEDDPALAELVRFNLERAGYAVEQTPDGHEALRIASASPPDVMLLDWMIEGLPGIDVCRRLRRDGAASGIPIIMITAKGEEADRIRGLDTGADDYITKPFSPRELLARVAAVLRRAGDGTATSRLSFGDLEMDLVSHRVRRDGRPVQLTPSEFRLLRHMLEKPRRIFTREALIAALGERETDIDVRAIDVHVRRIRMALHAPGKPDLIRTVRSAGYALELPEVSEAP
jgi:two-component system, OmpR family, phosphate regulon response regulator PhoB